MNESLHNDPIPVLTVQSLGSGSSGNGFLVHYGPTTVLLDCGIGIRAITAALRSIGRSTADLSAILLTHEHIDHIRTLPRVIPGGMPVVATSGTFGMTRIPDSQWLAIDEFQPVTVGALTIWALPVLHDAQQPCGYLIEAPDARATILTDLGSWRDNLAEAVASSDLIVLEANHDETMLRHSPYPAHLKRRVASDHGHLSNLACGRALAATLRHRTDRAQIWLAHLSQTNNDPGVAAATVSTALAAVDVDAAVLPLPRLSPGPVWTPATATIRPRYAERIGTRPIVPAQLGFDRFRHDD